MVAASSHQYFQESSAREAQCTGSDTEGEPQYIGHMEANSTLPTRPQLRTSCHVARWPGRMVSNGRHAYVAVGQNQRYHFGVGAPPILVYFAGDWDVHWGYDLGFDPWPYACSIRTSHQEPKPTAKPVSGGRMLGGSRPWPSAPAWATPARRSAPWRVRPGQRLRQCHLPRGRLSRLDSRSFSKFSVILWVYDGFSPAFWRSPPRARLHRRGLGGGGAPGPLPPRAA